MCMHKAAPPQLTQLQCVCGGETNSNTAESKAYNRAQSRLPFSYMYMYCLAANRWLQRQPTCTRLEPLPPPKSAEGVRTRGRPAGMGGRRQEERGRRGGKGERQQVQQKGGSDGWRWIRGAYGRDAPRVVPTAVPGVCGGESRCRGCWVLLGVGPKKG